MSIDPYSQHFETIFRLYNARPEEGCAADVVQLILSLRLWRGKLLATGLTSTSEIACLLLPSDLRWR